MKVNTIGGKQTVITRIGPYNVLKMIACGGFGCTFVAQHKWIPYRIFVVKILQERHRSSQQERDRFFDEAYLHGQLEHPYIVHLEDVGMDGDIPYIAMEYLPNGTLQDRINQMHTSRIPIQEALRIVDQLGQALDYLHKRSVVHRDIKPANVGFDEKGNVKLLDFGIAEILETNEVKEVTLLGSLLYMAPEQLTGFVCRESDQFVLASLAYELLTGYHPFPPHTVVLGRYQQLQKRPVSPRLYNSTLTSVIEEALLKAMNPDRLQRYRDVSTFIAALSEPSVHMPPPITTQKNKNYYVDEGNTYYKMKCFELALAAYNHALDLDNLYVLAYNNKGAALYQLGRYEEALTAFNKAKHYAPNCAIATFWRARILECLGRVEAQEVYREAYRLGYIRMLTNK